MREPTPATLLDAVRRRLRLLHWVRALRAAAWTSTALLISLALTHLWLTPIDAAVVLAAAAIPWLLAAGWALSRRITEQDCAGWADRHLGGASAFATWLETAGEPHASPAGERFLQWIAAAVPRSLATLQSLPLRLRLTKPLLSMIVSAVLAAIVLQISSPQSAGTRAKPAGATESRTAREELGRADPTDASPTGAAPSPAATAGKQDAGADTSRATGLSPLTDGEDSDATVLELATAPTAPTAGASGARAAAGGREAGDSPDTVQEPGLSPSWQGELARKLLSATDVTDPASVRADPSRAASYAAVAGPSDAAPTTRDPAPAPAAAPAARPQPRLGPAEQAYLRAYFAGSGATP
jgi:hypothetical protein